MKQFTISSLVALALVMLSGCADEPMSTTTTTEETTIQHPAPVTTTTETQRTAY
jgi:type IV pilus biogenesis protein CpaD/CtpE